MATLGIRQAMRGQGVLEVDPDCARNVGLLERFRPVATIEVPAHIGEHKVGVVEPGNGFWSDDRGDHVQHPASTFA